MEQVQTLQQERQRLRADLQQATEELKRTAGDQGELMRLRGEVTPLRQAAQELQALKTTAARAAPTIRAAVLPSAGVPTNLEVDHLVTPVRAGSVAKTESGTDELDS